MFTGLADTDKIILHKLSDGDLLNMCKVDRHFRKMCRDESFWRERFFRYFGHYAAKYKPQKRSWRNHYLKVIRDINILNAGKTKETVDFRMESYNWRFFSILKMKLGEEPLFVCDFDYENYVKTNNPNLFDNYTKRKVPLEENETSTNIYWLAPLTDKEKKTVTLKYSFPWNQKDEDISITYSLDYFDSLGDIWTQPQYFTPAKIVKIIRDFYNSRPGRGEIDKIERILEEEDVEMDREKFENMTYLEICKEISPNFGLGAGMYAYREGYAELRDYGIIPSNSTLRRMDPNDPELQVHVLMD